MRRPRPAPWRCGHLALARGRSRQQQVGDVRAGDQQNECDGDGEHPQRRPHRLADFALDANDLEPRLSIRGGARLLAADAQRNVLDLGGRRRQWNTVGEPRHHRQAARAAGLGRRHRKRRPELRVVIRKMKVRRHDPDHGVVLTERDPAAECVAVEGHRAAERGRVAAEVPLPGAMTQDDHLVAPRLLLVRRERAAQDRLHTEHRECG